MSYIVARRLQQEDAVAVDHGFILPEVDFRERDLNALDMNLDDEILDFVIGLIDQVNELSEGEALVIWKEIF